MKKSYSNSRNQKGIFISIVSCLAAFFILFIYSREVPAGGSIFLSHSLYNFAILTLFSFFVCIILFIIGLKKAFFSDNNQETDPSKLVQYIQLPFKNKKYILLFTISSVAYFTFFGFVSNIFIIFNQDNSVFSLIPSMFGPGANPHSHNHNSLSDSKGSIPQEQPMHQQSSQSSIHDQNEMEMSSNEKNVDASESIPSLSYPYYRLIICCNIIGYVPMLTLAVSHSFSILIIPLNILLGVIISTLVGFSLSLNIFLLRTIKIKSTSLTKRSLLSSFGMSSGLLIGCPTCAGSLIYSIAGFSSLVTFSSLISYQLFFISISIPLLLASVIVLAKLLQKRDMETCNFK